MENLPRWLFTSLVSHFETVASNNSIPYFVEGVDERDDSKMQASHAEMRVTGPNIKEHSKDWYHVEVVANVLLTSFMDTTGNAYEIVQWSGVFQKEMLEPIPVYKNGTGAQDTGDLIGCLRPKGDRNYAVKLFHFGQVDMTDRVRQSELDCIYEMDVTTDMVGS